MDLRQVLTVGALIGVVCWGAWVTKTIVTPEKPERQLVKLQLQGLVTEYLQLQARSGNEDQVAAAATTRFMSELDKAVAAVGKSGRLILVNEAVIGGDIPDITAQVKRAVYAKVPMPKVAVATPVQQDMQAYLSANGDHAAPAISSLDPMGAAGGNPQ
ncbi:type-F conjugative transfer system protein TrbI [Novosphingobium sp. JCM 18896]|uniref:type-F conjugative transfer system protein TrbI n=1 Tax=Novosphingobium sp. JCM 18896 TaxID=2989731 RepID=UPI00222323D0|nr:type-F conjugative transfer system protein TrbI [Novosphingobium sp. JCM 18896]MCW1432137.1 type-F conjugative transfer system protein TrbI [Novosphingobium sp. JCM 18896]